MASGRASRGSPALPVPLRGFALTTKTQEIAFSHFTARNRRLGRAGGSYPVGPTADYQLSKAAFKKESLVGRLGGLVG